MQAVQIENIPYDCGVPRESVSGPLSLYITTGSIRFMLVIIYFLFKTSKPLEAINT